MKKIILFTGLLILLIYSIATADSQLQIYIDNQPFSGDYYSDKDGNVYFEVIETNKYLKIKSEYKNNSLYIAGIEFKDYINKCSLIYVDVLKFCKTTGYRYDYNKRSNLINISTPMSLPYSTNTDIYNYNSSNNKTTATQCLGITKDGNRCQRMTTDPSGYCWQHK